MGDSKCARNACMIRAYILLILLARPLDDVETRRKAVLGKCRLPFEKSRYEFNASHLLQRSLCLCVHCASSHLDKI